MSHIIDKPKYKTLENVLKTKKYYRASSGIMRYLICRETNKKVVVAPTETEFLENVEKFFR
jgi:hypothetical protein